MKKEKNRNKAFVNREVRKGEGRVEEQGEKNQIMSGAGTDSPQ